MVTRWQRYLDEGIFRLATNIDNGQKITEFWTGPWPYWNMSELAPELGQWLSSSGLVIFKVSDICQASKGSASEYTSLRETSSKYLVDLLTPVSECFRQSYRK